MLKPVKRSGIGALQTFGVLRVARALQRARAVILTYHGVLSGSDDRADFLNHNFVAAAAFERHLQYIRQHYKPISLANLCACYEENRPPPPGSVVVTFDDGFANNYTVAFPLLQKYGIPFTIFLTTGMVDRPGAQLWSERVKRAIYLYPGNAVVLRVQDKRIQCQLGSPLEREDSARGILQLLKRLPTAERDAALEAIEDACGRPPLRPDEMERYQFLTWSEVQTMASAGTEFGSHTVHHPILSTLDSAALQSELIESKQHIESCVGKECYAFAYPNGSPADFGVREKLALKAAGYKCAVSLGGRLNGRRPDLYELDRINVGRQFDAATFQAALSGLLGGARSVRQAIRNAVGQRAMSPLAGAP